MYASIADMVERYGADEMIARTDLGASSEVPAAPVAAVLEPKLLDASALVDDYLRARYRVPLDQPPPRSIVAITCALARYALWQDAASERVTDDRDAAMTQLRDMARGLLHLDVAALATAPATTGALVSAPAETFTPSLLQGFIDA